MMTVSFVFFHIYDLGMGTYAPCALNKCHLPTGGELLQDWLPLPGYMDTCGCPWMWLALAESGMSQAGYGGLCSATKGYGCRLLAGHGWLFSAYLKERRKGTGLDQICSGGTFAYARVWALHRF